MEIQTRSRGCKETGAEKSDGREPEKPGRHDMALVTTLEKAEDVAVYAKHPEHVKVADTYVRPYTTERAALDYEE